MLIVFPTIPWGFLWQRPQQLLSQIASKGNAVLYFAPTCQSSSSHDTWYDLVAPNVFHLWCNLNKPMDIHHHPIDKIEAEQLLARISQILIEWGNPPLDILVQHPGWTQLALMLQAKTKGLLIYDCMDDFEAFSDITTAAIQDEPVLFARADLTFVSSAGLSQKAKKLGAQPIILRNAAQLEHFSNAQKVEASDKGGKKLAGYFGSIREWFDFEIVEFLARQRPNCLFKLIGKVEKKPPSSLTQLDNVSFVGELPYHSLPAELAQFDLALIPFVRNQLTEATNPVKIYEYFSLGVPTLAIRLPELEQYSECCNLYSNHAEALAQFDLALAESQTIDSPQRKRRAEIARANSWESRAKLFLESLFAARLSKEETIGPEPLRQNADRQHLQEMQAISTLYLNALKSQRQDFENEIKRIAQERDELLSRKEEECQSRLAQKDRDWGARVDQVAGDYQAEIRRIGAERDQMLADKDQAWRGELERVKAAYK